MRSFDMLVSNVVILTLAYGVIPQTTPIVPGGTFTYGTNAIGEANNSTYGGNNTSPRENNSSIPIIDRSRYMQCLGITSGSNSGGLNPEGPNPERLTSGSGANGGRATYNSSANINSSFVPITDNSTNQEPPSGPQENFTGIVIPTSACIKCNIDSIKCTCDHHPVMCSVLVTNQRQPVIDPGRYLECLGLEGPSSGGAPSGGAPFGGAPSGGSSFGGAPSRGASFGGAPSGRAPSGGASFGGSPFGGAPSGGAPSGESPPGPQSQPNFTGFVIPPATCKKCNIDLVNCTCDLHVFICIVLSQTRPPSSTTFSAIAKCDVTIDRVKAIFNITAGAFGLVGNLLVVIVTIVHLQQSTRCHLLIGGLAAVDLIFAAAQIIIFMPIIWTCQWLYGSAGCKIFQTCTNLSVNVALGFILIIALERYIGIVHPFTSWFTPTMTWILIGINVGIGLGITIPSLVYLKLNEAEICDEKWPSETGSLVYTISLFLLYFLIPVTVIAYMYFKIIQVLDKTVADKSILNSIAETQRQKRLKDNTRIMRILVSIMVAFVLLVFPNRLVWLITDIHGVKNLSSRTTKALSLFGFIPYSFHVAINPLIYSLIDVKFRKKVANLFLICSFAKLQSGSHSHSALFESTVANSNMESVQLKSMTKE